MRKLIKRILPKKLVKIIKKIKNKKYSLGDPFFLEEIDSKNRNKSNREIFSKIYETSAWNDLKKDSDNKVEYNSGPGSHDINFVNPYVDTVVFFLNSFKNKKTIVDLGCGDFNIGKNFLQHSKKYIACDVAHNVIEKHKSSKSLKNINNLEFLEIDLTKDIIPNCDIIIVRQVLQHLSNNAILSFLKNIKQTRYHFLIVTEYLPSKKFIPNLDQPSGAFSRLARGINSGVVLTEPPFNLKPITIKKINNIQDDDGGILETIVYKMS